jgi:Fe-S cluster assembly ATPase SufC
MGVLSVPGMGQSADRSTTVAVIRAQGLTKRYAQTVALDGLDLEVRRGEVYGFLGPNGAGKTIAPLIDALAGTPVASLTSREPSLEEIFVHHYRSPGPDVGG